MPLSIAAFVPDSPLLIKEINQQPTKEIERLLTSFITLANLIKTKNISTIILLSTGAENLPGKTSIVHDPVINGDLNDFGRPDISLTLAHDQKMAYQMAQLLEHTPYATKLISHQNIDYTFLVPLLLLKEVVMGLKIIPCVLQGQRDDNIKFGKTIRKIVERSSDNVLLLGCGEICRTTSRKLKAEQLTPQQKVFSEKILNFIKTNNLLETLVYDDKTLKKLNAQSLAVLQTIAACLNQTKTNNIIAANEINLGVNYLNVIFNL